MKSRTLVSIGMVLIAISSFSIGWILRPNEFESKFDSSIIRPQMLVVSHESVLNGDLGVDFFVVPYLKLAEDRVVECIGENISFLDHPENCFGYRFSLPDSLSRKEQTHFKVAFRMSHASGIRDSISNDLEVQINLLRDSAGLEFIEVSQ